MRKSYFVCFLCLTALFIFSDILQARGGRRGGRSDSEASPSAADSNDTSASTLNPVSITAGKNVGNIVLGKSTKADIIREYGSNFKRIDHKKYSTQLIYKHLGLSVYWYQKDTSKKIFSIHIEPPFKAVTKKGITLGKSRLKDVFRTYGSRKATNTNSHQYYTYPGITFYASRGGSASEQKIIKIAVRKSAASKMLSRLLNLTPIEVKPLSYPEYTTEHVNAFRPVHISSDGTTFVTRSQKEKELTYYLWRVTEKSAVLQAGLKLNMSSFTSSDFDYSAAFSGNGKYIAFSVPSAKYRHKKTVPIYDWNANRVFTVTVQAPKCTKDFAIRRICLNEDASKIAVSHKKTDKDAFTTEISVYKTQTGEEVARTLPAFSIYFYFYYQFCFSPSGRYLAIKFNRVIQSTKRTKGIKFKWNNIDGMIILDTRTGATLHQLNRFLSLVKNEKEFNAFLEKGNIRKINDIAISADDKHLAIATNTGPRIIEIGKNRFIVSDAPEIYQVCFGKDGQLLTQGARTLRYLFDEKKLTPMSDQRIDDAAILSAYSTQRNKWVLVGTKNIHTVSPFTDRELQAHALLEKGLEMINAEFHKPGIQKIKQAIDTDPQLETVDSLTRTIKDLAHKNVPLKYLGEILLYRYSKLLEGEKAPKILVNIDSDASGNTVISRVIKNGPADSAGIKKGDIVIALNEQPVQDAESLRKKIRTFSIGQTISLTVKRNGKDHTYSVKTCTGYNNFQKVRWAYFSLFEYGLLATTAGHPALAEQAAKRIRTDIIETYGPCLHQEKVERFPILLTAHSLAAAGKTDQAYNYIIEHDGIIVNNYKIPVWYIKFLPDIFKPLYANPKKLAYFLKIDVNKLPKPTGKTWSSQAYPDLTGTLLTPTSKPRNLIPEQKPIPVTPSPPTPKTQPVPEKEKPKATVLD